MSTWINSKGADGWLTEVLPLCWLPFAKAQDGHVGEVLYGSSGKFDILARVLYTVLWFKRCGVMTYKL